MLTWPAMEKETTELGRSCSLFYSASGLDETEE